MEGASGPPRPSRVEVEGGSRPKLSVPGADGLRLASHKGADSPRGAQPSQRGPAQAAWACPVLMLWDSKAPWDTRCGFLGSVL